MSLVNASTAWHCIARLHTDDEQAWEADPRVVLLLRQTKLLLSEFLAAKRDEDDEDTHHRCVATITWSCARLKFHDADMMSALGDLAVRWLWSFKPFELANVLWGLAKMQVEHAALFQAAHDYILRSPQLFPTRSLSMAAWAFATIRMGACQGLLCKMAGAFVAGLAAGDDSNPVTIANMVWALATTRAYMPREAMQAMGAVAATELESFKAHELSVMLWAFARLNACHKGLFVGAMGLLCGNQRLREEIHSQGIANLLWAFAKYSKDAHDGGAHMLCEVLTALSPTMLRLLPMLNSVEVSSSVWAISKLVPCWGQHPAADSILVEAAKGLLAKPQLLIGMSSQGTSGLLSVYSEFFHGSPCTPWPCRELVAQLAKFCASSEQEACAAQVRTKAAAAPKADEAVIGVRQCHVWAHAAREPTKVHAKVEPVQGSQGHAFPPPRGRVLAGWPSARSALGAPQTQSARRQQSLAGEPAYVYPCFATPGASAQPAGSGHPEWGPPSAMHAPLTRLVPECPLEVGSRLPAPQVPSITVVEEFTSSNEDLQENQVVDVAVEVNDNETKKADCIVVEVYDTSGKQDSFVLQAEDADAFGMYKLRLPQYHARWSVCFTLASACGEVIGQPASVAFLSKPSAVRLRSGDYRSATSSCLHTNAGHSTCAGSTCSDVSDSDHDQEAELPIVPQRVV